ncbi:MAG TPA: glycoside hydrolase family 32 protein [Parafilimonas sp.]|nr:glycoside hydrolase family 32 protein [Parafilimonas sp.]
MKKFLPVIFIGLMFLSLRSSAQSYKEKYRPLMHFSPKQHWMNDPNGLVYFNNIYHLFFQYYPNASVWGPMHWGHAISEDLVHWKQLPIAIYPDKLGYIFSGSVVVDSNNTSGFGIYGKPALVAIFTQHDTAGEHAHTNTFQNQSIAYSNDGGLSWTKYKNNPVVKNLGSADFRDPKVMWYKPGNKWIMTLAVKDHVEFYSSPDLKNWRKEGEFGKDVGGHGGVWECPDLFAFDYDGKQVWALLVSINPGGPNGGSATQYFIGDFNGNTFTPYSNNIKWIDYGPDNYAGVTFSNTGERKIFLGWMSNWNYAQLVPTETWRSAMTVPRNLNLMQVGDEFYITSNPVVELNRIAGKQTAINKIVVDQQVNLSQQIRNFQLPAKIDFEVSDAKSFSMIFSNENKEMLTVGYDETQKQFYINRKQSGETDFEKSFSGQHTAPRISVVKNIPVTIIADVSSVELFADDGLSVMTEIFFPSKPYNQLQLQGQGNIEISGLKYISFKNIWK